MRSRRLALSSPKPPKLPGCRRLSIASVGLTSNRAHTRKGDDKTVSGTAGKAPKTGTCDKQRCTKQEAICMSRRRHRSAQYKERSLVQAAHLLTCSPDIPEEATATAAAEIRRKW
jgi:hypothetical protein